MGVHFGSLLGLTRAVQIQKTADSCLLLVARLAGTQLPDFEAQQP